MTTYWTCAKCKRAIPYSRFLYGYAQPDEGYDPDLIDGARVCRACCAKEKKGD